ncbi:unnamed protein product [Nezara viridula]|uniref:Uncharacterized protein n=1 Tax=Nezara viridula TaxID=85310 RepID=A0A9P0MQB8_NEZVI|nr:unnamed protein product [Nezara viridula]
MVFIERFRLVKKMFTIEEKFNRQNDRMHARSSKEAQEVIGRVDRARLRSSSLGQFSTQHWLQKNIPEFISTSNWPSESPDYQLWSKLERMACYRAHPNLESLKKSLVRVVERFSRVLRAAIDDWPRRLNA